MDAIIAAVIVIRGLVALHFATVLWEGFWSWFGDHAGVAATVAGVAVIAAGTALPQAGAIVAGVIGALILIVGIAILIG